MFMNWNGVVEAAAIFRNNVVGEIKTDVCFNWDRFRGEYWFSAMATAEQAEHRYHKVWWKLLSGVKHYIGCRLLLPVPMYHSDYNIWSVLKNCIGKELSKITMPVVFNEPLSFLQRMSEYMEYSHLLRIASEQQDPLMRMQFVVGPSFNSIY